MDKYVVSLEQAKQLKKAGFPQDTVYKYYQVIVTGEVKLIAGDFEDLKVGGKHTRTFAAPMTDELRAQLPDKIKNRFVKLEIRTLGRSTHMPMLVEESLKPVTKDQQFHPDYNELTFDDLDRFETLANALSVLWLWCEDNNYLEEADK